MAHLGGIKRLRRELALRPCTCQLASRLLRLSALLQELGALLPELGVLLQELGVPLPDLLL